MIHGANKNYKTPVSFKSGFGLWVDLSIAELSILYFVPDMGLFVTYSC